MTGEVNTMSMYPFPTPGTLRQQATEDFLGLHGRAKLRTMLARFTGRKRKLSVFSKKKQSASHRFLGLQDIPVEQITGTLNRAEDYDREFRPLAAHLRDRWISAYLLWQAGAWEPI